MLIRSLLFIFMITLSLVASPNLGEIKAAVQANPALLNTPQAKAAMAKKGMTVADVKAKLKVKKTSNSSVSSEIDSTNDIDVTDDTTVSEQTFIKKSVAIKRVNPFKFESSQNINKTLSSKQQHFIKKSLKRYSNRFFANKNVINPSSMPTPDDYVISTGDTIMIYIYGDRDKTYTPYVNNDGTIELPFVGPIHIGGMKFKDAKKHLIENLKNHFKLSDFYINMKKYSTIQVTLVGDVKAPGLYNLASFSTVKDLLLASKGLRETASVRNLKIKRDGKVIRNIDFYNLLFKASHINTAILKQGDIVVVSKAKKLASVDGYVNDAAIFELKQGETLRTLIDYAGGMKPNASQTNIKVKRYLKNAKIKTFTISYINAQKFTVLDGDEVYIYPLDFNAVASVNIYGNIIRPGNYNLPKNKTLNTLLQNNIKQGKKQFFLPKTYFEYAVIKRYNDALEYETYSFNLLDVLANKLTVKLKPQDKIFIFAQNDIFTSSYITTKGSSLIKAGKFQYYRGMNILDAINASGIDGLIDDKVRVTTFNTKNFMPKTTFYSLKKEAKTLLNPYDVVEVFGYYDTHILEPVTIKGEVVKPGVVYYEKGMTLAKLLKIAGGFNKKAYTKSIYLTRYFIDENQTRRQKVFNYDLSKISLDNIFLEPYDEVKVSKILGWDTQDYQTIAIQGEVRNPITVKYGEGLSVTDLIIMAGGLTHKAYTKNIEIIRYYIDENEVRHRKILKLNMLENDFENIKLQPYDVVHIFKIPNWNENKKVTLSGEVKFPGTYTIKTGEKLSSVIKRAGGFTKEAFVDGAVFTRKSVQKNQIEQYNKTLARLKRQLAIFNSMPANAKNGAAVGNDSLASITEVIKEAKKYQPMGRISIKLDTNLTKMQESEYDLVLQDNDKLIIPSQIDTVTVFGEVFNPTSFVYNSGLDTKDYINEASGLARGADEDRIYVVHADGTSEPAVHGWWIFSSATAIKKGDTIVVPMYIKEYNQLDLWESVSKIMASFAITAATLQTIGVF